MTSQNLYFIHSFDSGMQVLSVTTDSLKGMVLTLQAKLVTAMFCMMCSEGNFVNYLHWTFVNKLVSWSLMSLISTSMAISETTLSTKLHMAVQNMKTPCDSISVSVTGCQDQHTSPVTWLSHFIIYWLQFQTDWEHHQLTVCVLQLKAAVPTQLSYHSSPTSISCKHTSQRHWLKHDIIDSCKKTWNYWMCCDCSQSSLLFTARCYASTEYVVVVCLSICHMSVLYDKWLNMSSCKQCHTIAQELYSLLMPKVLVKFQQGSPPMGGSNRGWVDSDRLFSTNIWIYLRYGAR